MCSSCDNGEHRKPKPTANHAARSLEEGYMKKHVVRTLLAGTAVGAALMLAATAALAATTLTVKVTGAASNGAVTASAGTTTVKDVRNGDTMTCESSTAKGTVKDQTTKGTAPVKIGTVSSTAATSCTGPAGTTFTVKMNGTWNLDITGTTSKGVTSGGVTNISTTLTGTACTATVTGSAQGTYTNPSGGKSLVLAFSPSAPNPDKFALKIASANCLGILQAGDRIQYTGSYTVTDPAALTVNAH
jgi:hypothetical protein